VTIAAGAGRCSDASSNCRAHCFFNLPGQVPVDDAVFVLPPGALIEGGLALPSYRN
jgi:hypothetical protein